MPPSAAAIPVLDPTGAARDAELPTLALALDPARAEAELARVPALAQASLASIRVVRHKPGRRCVIVYELDRFGTVYGKVQRRRYGKSGCRLLVALRAAGFDGVADGIAVPEPVGTVGAFRMWLQREVDGRPATELLGGPESPVLARRIAEAAHKLHAAGVPPERRHGVADELRILDECLTHVAAEQPHLRPRLRRLGARCAEAGARLGDARSPLGIHRDFYADQVLVNGRRLTLVDFDLYCLGDPALDIGNFVGHVLEQGLRTRSNAAAFAAFVEALERRYAELAGREVAERVPTWTALTLARHVFLSTRFEERRPLTEPTLELAEAKLEEVGA